MCTTGNKLLNVVEVELHSHDAFNSEQRKMEKKMPSLFTKHEKIDHI